MSRLAKLELKQLRLLQALLRERSVSRVADHSGLSQQTVSEHLKRLREVFEDRLFVRTGNGIIPTPLAERLTPRLDKLLTDVESLLNDEPFNPQHVDGVFNVSATDYEQRAILPPLLKQLRLQAPALKVIVHKLEIDKMAQQLAAGEIDLVLSTPGFVPEGCPTLLLYRESYICVAAKNSRLIRTQEQAFDARTLAPLEQLVVSPSRGDLRGMADHWFEQQGFKRNVVLSVPSFAAAAECVAETDTLAFLPSRLLPDARLQTVMLTEHPPGFDVIAAWHNRSGQDPLHLWVRELLRTLCY